MVFVDVARQPIMAAQKPNILKLSSVTDVKRIPPTIGIKEAHMRHSKYFLQTNHCRITVYNIYQNMRQQLRKSFVEQRARNRKPVVAGVKDFMVCMKETGM